MGLIALLSYSCIVCECIYEINLFFFVVEEPVTGKKRKGKDTRPLRIDLILQHDSLVPPPKESVFVTTYRDTYSTEKYRDFFPFSASSQKRLIKKFKMLCDLFDPVQ